MEPLVLIEQDGPLSVLTLNRPRRHNSLVPELLQAFLEALHTLERQAGPPQAVILRAAGRSFSTGGDIQGFVEHLETIAEYSHHLVGLLNEAILALLRFPVPIVAAVHGPVTGGSLGLVLACDHVFVSPEASFTPYYSVVGFSPDGGWTALLPQVIGLSRTRAVLEQNLTITAQQTVAWGLASEMVPSEALPGTARAAALKLAGMQPGSITNIRALLAYDQPAARLEEERRRFVNQIATPETQKSMLAFYSTLTSRKPS